MPKFASAQTIATYRNTAIAARDPSHLISPAEGRNLAQTVIDLCDMVDKVVRAFDEMSQECDRERAAAVAAARANKAKPHAKPPSDD